MLDGSEGPPIHDGGESPAGPAGTTARASDDTAGDAPADAAGGTMVVLAGRSAADLRAAWVTPSGSATALSRPDGAGAGAPDAVEEVAEALAGFLADAPGVPGRLWMIAPPDTEFSDHDEATALAALPAPTWMPLPVALAGARLAARLYGPVRQRHHWAGADDGRTAVVLDARADRLTAWPVRRGPDGPSVVRGPLELIDRLDQLVGGVVKATLAPTGAGPSGGAPPVGAGAAPASARRDAALLRRAVRRARLALAGSDVAEATVVVGEREAVVERAVFEQLVAHAVTECLTRLEPDAGVELLVDPDAPIAPVLVRTTGAALPPRSAATPSATDADGAADPGDAGPEGSAAVEGAAALLVAAPVGRAAVGPAAPAGAPVSPERGMPVPGTGPGGPAGPPRLGSPAGPAPSASPTAPVPVVGPGPASTETSPASPTPGPAEEPGPVDLAKRYGTPGGDEPSPASSGPEEEPAARPDEDVRRSDVSERPREDPSVRPGPGPSFAAVPPAAPDRSAARSPGQSSAPAQPPAPAQPSAPSPPARRTGRVVAVAVLAVVLLVVLVAAIGVLVLGPRPDGWMSGTGAVMVSAPASPTGQDVTAST